MAIRKSKEENFSVNGSINEWMKKCESALNKGGFKRVSPNTSLNQITADYKKLTIWGDISITLIEENPKVKIHVTSTANTDNLFALFTSPNQKILNQFKENL